MDYHKRVQFINEKSQHMIGALLDPQIDGSTGKFIGDKRTTLDRLETACSNSIFEQAGKGARTIQATAAHALRGFCERYGRLPSGEMLASAYQAINTGLQVTGGKPRTEMEGFVLEAAEMDTTEGVIMRDRMIALILPVMLSMVTSNMVTHIPGQFNQSEIFKIHRIAGTTFGDLTKGDRIGNDFNGQYSSMDQRHAVADGDGTEVGGAGSTTPDYFEFDSATAFGAAQPFKRKRCKVFHDHDHVATDDGNGNLLGTFVVGATTITVTGSVDYANGVINPIFSTAPANGIKIDVGMDIDIEKDPTLIPLVTTEMEAATLYPHESAIAANTTLQALWALRREFSLDANNMDMGAMRNLLSGDKDRKILKDLRYFAKNEKTFDITVPTALYFQEHYEMMKQTLLDIDQALMQANGVAGLSGVVADSASAIIFKSMKAPSFVPVPGYKRVPQPHYCGKLFGLWDLYEDPQGTDYENLCFSKGRGVGECGYVVGDAVPAMSFKHAMQRDLQYKNTLWELAYRDLNPFNGRDYYTKFKLIQS